MISPAIQQLFNALKRNAVRSDWSQYEGSRITTNKITNSVGSFYERVRYMVDYQEEHVIRQIAIERMVKRLAIMSSVDKIGRDILEELVVGQYLENGEVPEVLADEVQVIINNYYNLRSYISGDRDIVWSYAAIDIERCLFPADAREGTFLAVFQTVVQYIKPKEPEEISIENFNLYVYIACRRVFLRESLSTLNYSIFRLMVPAWNGQEVQSEEIIQSVAARFPKLQKEIAALMTHPLQWKIASRIKNEAIYFTLVYEIVRKFGVKAEEILSDTEQLGQKVSVILSQAYAAHKAKIKRSGTRAILYIFITKIIIGMAFELPYEIFILKEINYVALAINILFFPLILFLMTKTLRYPDEENTNIIIKNLDSFIRGEEQNRHFISVLPRTIVQRFGHILFSFTFFTLTFGLVLYFLEILQFNIVSTALFLSFLCIVTYMGLRIRAKSREWMLEDDDDSFGGLLGFLFVMPITRTGRWIAEQLSSVNIFVFFLDFILETPFKLILGSFDSFISYVRESRRDSM